MPTPLIPNVRYNSLSYQTEIIYLHMTHENIQFNNGETALMTWDQVVQNIWANA